MGHARSRLETVTVIAGLVAAMTVTGTLAAALTLLVGPAAGPPSGPPDGASADRAGEARAGTAVRHVVREVPGSDGLRLGLAMPDDAWSAAGPETVAGYRRPAGEPLVVTGPVFFHRGWCAEDPRWSSRAFAGVVRQESAASPRAVGDRLSRAWSEVVADSVGDERADGVRAPGPGRARASPVRVDGHPGWLTTRSVTLSSTGPCLPPRVSVDVLTLVVAGDVVAVVVVRDGGVPDALTRPAAARLLAETRVLPQSLRNRT